MTTRTDGKSEACREFLKGYVDEEGELTLTKGALARALYVERGDLFDSFEDARYTIRYVTGNTGGVKKKAVENTGFYQPQTRTVSEVLQKYGLTPQQIKETEPFTISESGIYGVLSDIHFPYHEAPALEAALNQLAKAGVTHIILNGDIMDFYQCSDFNRDPTRAGLREERDMLEEFYDFLDDAFGVPIFYKMGNHEERLENYLMRKAPAIFDVPEMSLKAFLKCDEYNITYIGGRQKIKLGQLNIMHGHEWGRQVFSPVNPARGLFNKAKTNALCGHHHQRSEHDENNLDGDAITCWSTGCLSNLSPRFRPFGYTKWNHGAATVQLYDDGSFSVDNFRIDNGKVR